VQGILSRIDALAQRIGTTAGHLWDVYVAQARVEAITDTAIVVSLLIVAAVVGFFGVPKLWALGKLRKKEAPSHDYTAGDGYFGTSIFYCYSSP
jgi:hypothetical protein